MKIVQIIRIIPIVGIFILGWIKDARSDGPDDLVAIQNEIGLFLRQAVLLSQSVLTLMSWASIHRGVEVGLMAVANSLEGVRHGLELSHRQNLGPTRLQENPTTAHPTAAHPSHKPPRKRIHKKPTRQGG